MGAGLGIITLTVGAVVLFLAVDSAQAMGRWMRLSGLIIGCGSIAAGIVGLAQALA